MILLRNPRRDFFATLYYPIMDNEKSQIGMFFQKYKFYYAVTLLFYKHKSKHYAVDQFFGSGSHFVKSIFGHFKNVQKKIQPINNAGLPNNSNTY